MKGEEHLEQIISDAREILDEEPGRRFSRVRPPIPGIPVGGDMSKVLTMVLAGGEGKRLAPLTADRAKPAVPFGGNYRLIDFALSNLVNANYHQIVVLTQYKSHSLDKPRHHDRGACRRCWATTSRRCPRRCGSGRAGSWARPT